MADPGIIRNRAKVESTIKNARACLAVVEETGASRRSSGGSWAARRKVNHWQALKEILPETPESKAMSKELKRRGFGFVGPTICYAFMQAVGMVDDHVESCFLRRQAEGRRGSRATAGRPHYRRSTKVSTVRPSP